MKRILAFPSPRIRSNCCILKEICGMESSKKGEQNFEFCFESERMADDWRHLCHQYTGGYFHFIASECSAHLCHRGDCAGLASGPGRSGHGPGGSAPGTGSDGRFTIGAGQPAGTLRGNICATRRADLRGPDGSYRLYSGEQLTRTWLSLLCGWFASRYAEILLGSSAHDLDADTACRRCLDRADVGDCVAHAGGRT